MISFVYTCIDCEQSRSLSLLASLLLLDMAKVAITITIVAMNFHGKEISFHSIS